MQITRQRIIDLLRKQGPATVDDLAQAIGLTPMAIRHHLNVLQADDLIKVSQTQRRPKAGRPVQIYSLTDRAWQVNPQNYFHLTDLMVEEILARVGPAGVADIFDGVADRLQVEAPLPPEALSLAERLEQLAAFLRGKGYTVEWEGQHQTYFLHHLDCPYRRLAQRHNEICLMDEKIITALLKVAPTRISCIAHQDDKCTYVISAA